MPLLWRYLLRSYFQVFFLCISGFIALLLLTRLQEIARLAALDSTLPTLLLFTLCQIPYILPIAIPISGLIAAMLLSKRLSQDLELTVFRSAGLSLTKITMPLLASAFLLSLANFVIVSELTPRSRLLSQKLFHEASTINPLLLIKKNKAFKLKNSYIDMEMSHIGKQAIDVIFAAQNQSQNRLTLFIAKKLVLKKNQLIGENVSLITHIDSKNPAQFDHLMIDNQEKIFTSAKSLSDMMQKQRFSLGYEFYPLRELLQTLSKQKNRIKTKNELLFELTRRLFFSLITYAFTFMGISMGLQIGKERKQKGIVLVILLTALTFICSIAAKSYFLFFYRFLFFYFCPNILIFIGSFWFQKRAKEGIE